MGTVKFVNSVIFKSIFFTLLITIFLTASLYAVDYYVDSGFGSDKNTGLSAGSAWQSLDKVNAVVFKPGDRILFRSGGTWSGQLWPKGSGSAGRPVVIDKYGEGGLPVFNGEGGIYGGENMSVTVKLFNQQYWELWNFYECHPRRRCKQTGADVF